MKVSEIMSRDVQVARPQDTIQSAARRMAEIDAGSLPVVDGQKIQGMITDRDIAVRAVAEGRSFETPVADVMTPDAEYCFIDDELDVVADKMADAKVRRLPVLDRDHQLVGIVALGDVAKNFKDKPTGQTLEEISRGRPQD